MSLFLPEVLLLIGFIIFIPHPVMSHLAGFFYGLWFYSTQIDHSLDYAYFLTASFFCIWVVFMVRCYRGVKVRYFA